MRFHRVDDFPTRVREEKRPGGCPAVTGAVGATAPPPYASLHALPIRAALEQ